MNNNQKTAIRQIKYATNHILAEYMKEDNKTLSTIGLQNAVFDAIMANTYMADGVVPGAAKEVRYAGNIFLAEQVARRVQIELDALEPDAA